MAAGMGHHKSASRFGKRKEEGITPTMGYACPSNRKFFPMTFGSALKRRRQKRSLMRTALGPLRASSSGVNSRPGAGTMPHTWKKREETQARVTFSGNAPVDSETSSV